MWAFSLPSRSLTVDWNKKHVYLNLHNNFDEVYRPLNKWLSILDSRPSHSASSALRAVNHDTSFLVLVAALVLHGAIPWPRKEADSLHYYMHMPPTPFPSTYLRPVTQAEKQSESGQAYERNKVPTHIAHQKDYSSVLLFQCASDMTAQLQQCTVMPNSCLAPRLFCESLLRVANCRPVQASFNQANLYYRFHANGWGIIFAAPLNGAALVLPGRNYTSFASKKFSLFLSIFIWSAAKLLYGVNWFWDALGRCHARILASLYTDVTENAEQKADSLQAGQV